MAAAASGRDPIPVGNQAPHTAYSGALMASDCWFVLTIAEACDLNAVAAAIGVATIRLDAALPGEKPHVDAEGRRDLAAWAGARCRADCLAALAALGLPCAPVEDARGVVEDYPELWTVGHLVRLPHPEMGDAVYNAPPIRLRDAREPSLRRAPLIGEHTAEALAEWIGIGDEELRRLHGRVRSSKQGRGPKGSEANMGGTQ